MSRKIPDPTALHFAEPEKLVTKILYVSLTFGLTLVMIAAYSFALYLSFVWYDWIETKIGLEWVVFIAGIIAFYWLTLSACGLMTEYSNDYRNLLDHKLVSVVKIFVFCFIFSTVSLMFWNSYTYWYAAPVAVLWCGGLLLRELFDDCRYWWDLRQQRVQNFWCAMAYWYLCSAQINAKTKP